MKLKNWEKYGAEEIGLVTPIPDVGHYCESGCPNSTRHSGDTERNMHMVMISSFQVSLDISNNLGITWQSIRWVRARKT